LRGQDCFPTRRSSDLGPQGTLYGRNTTGGALKIITNKADPGAKLGGYAKVGVGNYNAKRLETGINIPLVQDTLALRMSGLMNKRSEEHTSELQSRENL